MNSSGLLDDIPAASPGDGNPIGAFLALAGKRLWPARIAELQKEMASGARYGRLIAQRHAAELSVEKARRGMTLAPAEQRLAARAVSLAALHKGLNEAGKIRFIEALRASLTGAATLIPLLHLHRTAELQAARGFQVSFSGFESATPFDLLIARDGAEAEIACDTLSAEAGRLVRRAAWMRLIDRIDPDLQTWLAAHPGRYLLKMTLPQGLREDGSREDREPLAQLHQRINTMLATARRSDHDEAAVLRLDPLMLAAAQAGESGLMGKLRQDFGPEAHLAVTSAGPGVFVMAARSGAEDEVAIALRRRLASLAPARLSGSRPGILAMFIEDTDRLEWRSLREQLTLEGEARQFLTAPEARPVIAVTCASRFELCEAADAAPEGDLRFRNPSHPAAKLPALAPAVLSSL
ncbi:MAG TPA: hypothetical protein VFN77_09665 [Acetobacteraceae bacterium]|nr:hypothetical protein [Acetobacteraceae bacterium]